MLATTSRTTNSAPSTTPQYLVETVAHLREAAVNLREALAFAHTPSLFAAEAQQRRNLYTDLDALLAQLDAMRMQLAEYVEAAEDHAEHVH